MPWNKNRKHQKLIYSTELRLNNIKNPISFFLLKNLEINLMSDKLLKLFKDDLINSINNLNKIKYVISQMFN